jgi:hypothetical protein
MGFGRKIFARFTSVDFWQVALRRVNSDAIERCLLSRWGKIPANTPENVEFLEKVAAAASLLPAERHKLGLK